MVLLFSEVSTLDGMWDVMCIADVLAWSLSMRPIFAVVYESESEGARE